MNTQLTDPIKIRDEIKTQLELQQRGFEQLERWGGWPEAILQGLIILIPTVILVALAIFFAVLYPKAAGFITALALFGWFLTLECFLNRKKGIMSKEITDVLEQSVRSASSWEWEWCLSVVNKYIGTLGRVGDREYLVIVPFNRSVTNSLKRWRGILTDLADRCLKLCYEQLKLAEWNPNLPPLTGALAQAQTQLKAEEQTLGTLVDPTLRGKTQGAISRLKAQIEQIEKDKKELEDKIQQSKQTIELMREPIISDLGQISGSADGIVVGIHWVKYIGLHILSYLTFYLSLIIAIWWAIQLAQRM